MIRVALVDDQTLVRSGIRGLLDLTDDIRVVAEAADGIDAGRVLAQTAVDVLLLDVRMPGRGGVELLRESESLPPTIMLTTFDDDDALFDAMRAGARGFLLKDISLERLADGIRAVVAGETLFRPALTERTRASFRRNGEPAAASLATLTGRETEVLALMAGGLSNAEIAASLGCGEGTVKNHVSSILAKLGVRDRVRAVLRGIELELI
ncbi:response regulator [Pseudoduganella albidiflava]|uniref:DNA-binding response regulator n=1 Tax=Pseudoduganella albidiflava TaxID=321983 RepID=A0A411X6H9_9BURK|nr:response regulator transcription factor [Pseudoduganella albidiflava]QBI04589.1 response regulator transcription factor [Pseudoduganella albidiflava]GGY28491.1 DNA-binding response regulator [Pseudoduganella albidiflava]